MVEPVGDDLPDVLGWVEPASALVDVADLDRLTDPQGARVGFFLADDHLEQGGLADAVRADDADDAGARQIEIEPVDQDAVVESLGELLGLKHHAAQPGSRRDVDLAEVDLAVALGLGRQFLITGQSGLVLGLPSLRGRPHPLQFTFQDLGALGVFLALDRQALALGLQVGRVVALVREQPAAVDLADPADHVVEEVAVVRDAQHRPGVALQVPLQPAHRLGVQVVRGLVEQQQVGLLQQQFAQCDTTTLAAGQHVDDSVRRRATQRVHGLLEARVDVPRVPGVQLGLQFTHLCQQGVEVGLRVGHRLGDLVVTAQHALDLSHALLDVLKYRLARGERRFLQQDADRGLLGQLRVAVVDGLDARHHLEQGRLAGAVGADDADLRVRIERQRDVVENQLLADRLADVVHGVDELSHFRRAFPSFAVRGGVGSPSYYARGQMITTPRFLAER